MLDPTNERRDDLTSYDAERQADIDAEWEAYEKHRAWRNSLTPEKLRELGYHESEEYPGYFVNDPRYPNFSVEDRYLMDHPGPSKIRPMRSRFTDPDALHDWEGRAGAPHAEREEWDDEQFNGQALESWTPPARPQPKVIPVRSGEAERILQTQDIPQDYPTTEHKLSGLWVCRVCRKNFARWPSERALRLEILGLNVTVVFRSPLACTTCRVMEQSTVRWLGNEGARPFWTALIQIWEGETLPTAEKWTRMATRVRNAALASLRAAQRVWRRRA